MPKTRLPPNHQTCFSLNGQAFLLASVSYFSGFFFCRIFESTTPEKPTLTILLEDKILLMEEILYHLGCLKCWISSIKSIIDGWINLTCHYCNYSLGVCWRELDWSLCVVTNSIPGSEICFFHHIFRFVTTSIRFRTRKDRRTSWKSWDKPLQKGGCSMSTGEPDFFCQQGLSTSHHEKTTDIDSVASDENIKSCDSGVFPYHIWLGAKPWDAPPAVASESFWVSVGLFFGGGARVLVLDD